MLLCVVTINFWPNLKWILDENAPVRLLLTRFLWGLKDVVHIHRNSEKYWGFQIYSWCTGPNMNMSKELSYYLLTVNVKLMNTSTLFFCFVWNALEMQHCSVYHPWCVDCPFNFYQLLLLLRHGPPHHTSPPPWLKTSWQLPVRARHAMLPRECALTSTRTMWVDVYLCERDREMETH